MTRPATLVRLSPARLNGATARVHLRSLWIQRLAQHAAHLPPVDAFFDGQTFWLADGAHRLAAWQSLGFKTVPVYLRVGAEMEALIFGSRSNARWDLEGEDEDEDETEDGTGDYLREPAS